MDCFPSATNFSSSFIDGSSSSSYSLTTNTKEKTIKVSKKGKGAVKLSTDPQSVAARERRHRISDRFKILQSMVPGGTKMDTVSMLDEAIHYVKFLKTQIWLHQAMINECPSLFVPSRSFPVGANVYPSLNPSDLNPAMLQSQELWSLLEFMIPDLFATKDVDLKKLLNVEDRELVGRMKSIMGPFILRRLKSDVMQQLVPNMQRVEYVIMEKQQEDVYREAIEEYHTISQARITKLSESYINNIVGILPRLRRVYKDEDVVHFSKRLHSMSVFECTLDRVIEELRNYNDFSIHQAVDTVVAGILHDVVDDTCESLFIIEAEFGDDVARLVAGVSRLNYINQLLRRHRRINVNQSSLGHKEVPAVGRFTLSKERFQTGEILFQPCIAGVCFASFKMIHDVFVSNGSKRIQSSSFKEAFLEFEASRKPILRSLGQMEGGRYQVLVATIQHFWIVDSGAVFLVSFLEACSPSSCRYNQVVEMYGFDYGFVDLGTCGVMLFLALKQQVYEVDREFIDGLWAGDGVENSAVDGVELLSRVLLLVHFGAKVHLTGPLSYFIHEQQMKDIQEENRAFSDGSYSGSDTWCSGAEVAVEGPCSEEVVIRALVGSEVELCDTFDENVYVQEMPIFDSPKVHYRVVAYGSVCQRCGSFISSELMASDDSSRRLALFRNVIYGRLVE
ncbi:hypothetical protein F3Y22_tig00110483pilonHSYRG00287 [Hibiscus syriacus]|uniref:BHLH domain-containing protein n=1 Tax=Hibiscus syriacus TaxID=106335 RepID=A0A6A3AHT8_HIBSY|nr:hypothetical protein F3Y22_tig00110483pilonHSYRG00287 [Hibiscus syriacus]